MNHQTFKLIVWLLFTFMLIPLSACNSTTEPETKANAHTNSTVDFGLVLEPTMETAVSPQFPSDVINNEELVAQPTATPTPTPNSITTITDDSGILTVDVPFRWANTRSDLVTTDYRVLQVSLWAAADVHTFPGDWSQPGLFYHADFTIPGSDALLQQSLNDAAALLPTQCEPQPIGEYGTQNYPYGIVQIFLNCQDNTDVQVFIGTNSTRSYIVTMMVPMIDRADIDALDPIFASLGVNDTAVQTITDNLPGNDSHDGDDVDSGSFLWLSVNGES